MAAALAVAACVTVDSNDPQAAERRFYEARCGICHPPFARSEYAPEDWPGVVADMAPRAGLTRSQRARILAYLTGATPTAASAAAPPTR